MLETIDARDLTYGAIGLALLGLTLQPGLRHWRLLNLPLFYLLFGAIFGALGGPVIDPTVGGVQTKVIEHASELIVIISLAGAGLAIDTPASWRNWQPAYRLLLIAMPLTILAVALLGQALLGLGLAASVLLAAALAPTDPVLAQSVQVGAPGQEETPMRVALTAEAGLNDGLAFPFVWLAIAIASYGWAGGWPDWGAEWVLRDLIYRVVMGVALGYATGYVLSRLAYSRWGDASNGSWNSIVMVLAATLISYAVAEGADAYGFLAVFFCARAGRANARKIGSDHYEKFVHHGADQLEAILLAVLLLWLGSFLGHGALSGLKWQEVLFAALLIFVIRPGGGLLALIGVQCGPNMRRSVAFFGIRGMGSVFYLAYGQTHAEFTEIEAVWRVAAITILASILIHGYAARFFLEGEDEMDFSHPMKHLRSDPEAD